MCLYVHIYSYACPFNLESVSAPPRAHVATCASVRPLFISTLSRRLPGRFELLSSDGY